MDFHLSITTFLFQLKAEHFVDVQEMRCHVESNSTLGSFEGRWPGLMIIWKSKGILKNCDELYIIKTAVL
jgi:hypothetical protein